MVETTLTKHEPAGDTPASIASGKRSAADAMPFRAALRQRADELNEAGAHGEALACLDRALALHPDDARLHTARGWAIENIEPVQLAEARTAYEAAIALDPDELWASVGLATVLGRLGEAWRCPSIYREVVERAGPRTAREPETIELLGWCLYRLGKLDAAAETFRRALAIDDTWISVRFDLGLVLLLLGDAEQATGHYRCGLQSLAGRDPGPSSAALKIALEDLDDALQQHPALAAMPGSIRLRAQLADMLSPGHG